jgi:hypothetical protein
MPWGARLSLRSQAEELRTVGVIMSDPLSRRAMFQMAHTYKMMADLLEKTSKQIKIAAERDVG